MWQNEIKQDKDIKYSHDSTPRDNLTHIHLNKLIQTPSACSGWHFYINPWKELTIICINNKKTYQQYSTKMSTNKTFLSATLAICTLWWSMFHNQHGTHWCPSPFVPPPPPPSPILTHPCLYFNRPRSFWAWSEWVCKDVSTKGDEMRE